MGHLWSLHGEIAALQPSGANLVAEGVPNPGNFVADDLVSSGGVVRKDVNGNGGDYAVRRTGVGTSNMVVVANESGILGKTAEEFFVRLPQQRFVSGSYIFQYWNSSQPGRIHCEVYVNTDGSIEIHTDQVFRNTLAGVLPVSAVDWPVLTFWIRIDPTNGFVRVYKDFNYNAPILEFTGQVYRSFGSPPANVDEYNVRVTGNPVGLDDCRAQDITMEVSGSAGSWLVGQTVTGDTTSATALITRVDTHPVTGNLWLQLREVDDGATDWDGLIANDPFAGETGVTSSGGGTGVPVNAGLDPDSGLVPDGYIAAAMVPDGQGFQTNLSSDPAQVPADQWENVIYDGVGGTTVLGLGPDSEVSSNFDAVGGNGDAYTLTNPTVPPSQISTVRYVRTYAWARKEGTGIDNIQLGVRQGGTNGLGAIQALSASYDVFTSEFKNNPNTGVPWLQSASDELNTMEILGQFS